MGAYSMGQKKKKKKAVCTSLSSLLFIVLFIKSHILFLHILLVCTSYCFALFFILLHILLFISFFTYIYALVWCYFYISFLFFAWTLLVLWPHPEEKPCKWIRTPSLVGYMHTSYETILLQRFQDMLYYSI